MPIAKLVIAFQFAWGFRQREAWGLTQREQEYSVHKKKRYAVTLSICASSFHSPIGTFLPAEKLFAKASGDPHGLSDVS